MGSFEAYAPLIIPTRFERSVAHGNPGADDRYSPRTRLVIIMTLAAASWALVGFIASALI